jgi:3',5'-cyclic AMP phosphodiesterase CpdA
MRRIAHLSDVHILDRHVQRRRDRYRIATKLVSLGRSIDPVARRGRLTRALARAKASGAEHFVISGDLTELGEDTEFEDFAGALDEAALPEGSVTLVPGNHDAYTNPSGWARALAGPLARFASASAPPGDSGVRVVERQDVVFFPIDSSRFQSIALSGGIVTSATAEALERRICDPTFRDKALVLVLHHPPFSHAARLLRWVDGLRGCAEIMGLLTRHPRLQLLHGHLHRVVNRFRVFGAPATCDGPDDHSRIRLYNVTPPGPDNEPENGLELRPAA